MRRVFPCCAVIAGGVLAVSLLGQSSGLQPYLLRGTYAFTLSEKCIHQLSANTPGFDSNLHLVDPMGAETYSGASDGLMVFDGFGGATIIKALATNVMNATNRILPPIITPIPLGFGLGPALPFTCNGNYTLTAGKGRNAMTSILLPLTCTATVPLPNALGTTGFTSLFTFKGILPLNTSNLVLTDIGDTVQPVMIHFPASGTAAAFSVMQQRICTRAATLVLVNPEPIE